MAHLAAFTAALKADGRRLANCPFNLLQAEDEEESAAQIKRPLSTQIGVKTDLLVTF